MASLKSLTLVCYYTSWSQYRPDPYKFKPENVDSQLCTHINWAFGNIDATTFELKDYEWNDEELMVDLNRQVKEKNPSVKTLLSLGGWNFNNKIFSDMVESKANRDKFVDSSVKFLRERGFDGIDLDWEYPGALDRSGRPQDKQNYVLLLNELRAAYDAEGLESPNPKLLITMAAGVGTERVRDGYDIPAMMKPLDFCNLMTYDINGAWDSRTGHNAPLRGPGELTLEKIVDSWLGQGAPAEKLTLGMPTYGRSFRLAGPDVGVGSAAAGAGTSGPYTREGGILSWYEVEEKLRGGGSGCLTRSGGCRMQWWGMRGGRSGSAMTTRSRWVPRLS